MSFTHHFDGGCKPDDKNRLLEGNEHGRGQLRITVEFTIGWKATHRLRATRFVSGILIIVCSKERSYIANADGSNMRKSTGKVHRRGSNSGRLHLRRKAGLAFQSQYHFFCKCSRTCNRAQSAGRNWDKQTWSGCCLRLENGEFGTGVMMKRRLCLSAQTAEGSRCTIGQIVMTKKLETVTDYNSGVCRICGGGSNVAFQSATRGKWYRIHPRCMSLMQWRKSTQIRVTEFQYWMGEFQNSSLPEPHTFKKMRKEMGSGILGNETSQLRAWQTIRRRMIHGGLHRCGSWGGASVMAWVPVLCSKGMVWCIPIQEEAAGYGAWFCRGQYQRLGVPGTYQWCWLPFWYD